MSKIKEQGRVIVIENNEIRRGTVGKIFESLGVAIVNFDDGDVKKVRLSELGIEPVAEPSEQVQEPTEPEKAQEKNEISPDENAEVNITYGDFRSLSIETAMKISRNPIEVVRLVAYGAYLASRMFPAKEND